tara:strand:- start:173753 stop:176587 length:2835 start_codon:yes stop_codon:yes gene_type:complete
LFVEPNTNRNHQPIHEDSPVHTDSPKTTRSFRRSAAIISPLALVLAAGLAGCQSDSSLTRTNTNNTFSTPTRVSEANQATVVIDPSQIEGTFTSNSYSNEGDQVALPQQWVSEARSSTAEIQARRANAQSFEVVADSNFNEATAQADADLQNGVVGRDIGYADAQRTSDIHNARLSQMNNQIESNKFSNGAKWKRQEAFLTASVSEWQSEIERMRSESERDWSDSLAEHDRMMASYAAVQSRGLTEIDKMTKIADLTEERAVSKVQSLRTDAQTVADQADAEVNKLNQLVKTTTEQTNASYAELTQRARSLEGEMSSEIAMLNAQANQFHAADADASFTLEVDAVQTNYTTTISEAEDLRLDAQEQDEHNKAYIARLNSDAKATFESAQTSFDKIEHWISVQYTKATADISDTLAQAERAEQIARGEFVKAETDARVAALKEQATHDRALAKSEIERIEAESLATATGLQAKFAKEFSDQIRKGSFVIPSQDEETTNSTSSDDSTPTFASSNSKTPSVEADRIAAFRIGLAKATQFRQQANADRMDAMASRDSEFAKLNNWWNSKQADHQATLASIDSFSQKSSADVSRMLTDSESMIASAETERTRSLVDAESGRTEVLATIETIRGKSSTLNTKKDAQVKQLFAQAEATKRIGESKVASLNVQRESVARRGQAKSTQLLAEASSLEQSQRATVSQMRMEIASSRQILDAELARLNQAAESFYAVAQANYNEGVAMADAFERIAIANTSELTARHIASRKQSEADIEYMQHLASAGELMRDAEVTRLYAQADEALGIKQAQDIATRGQIEADQQIAHASSIREFTVANAMETGVRARFDHRVAMTEAERNRAYADVYAQSQQQAANTEIAAAQAATYSELSQAALARLNTASQSFQLTAQRNWDSRLAMPTQFAAPTNVDDLYESSEQTFNFGEFATVPTDIE